MDDNLKRITTLIFLLVNELNDYDGDKNKIIDFFLTKIQNTHTINREVHEELIQYIMNQQINTNSQNNYQQQTQNNYQQQTQNNQQYQDDSFMIKIIHYGGLDFFEEINSYMIFLKNIILVELYQLMIQEYQKILLLKNFLNLINILLLNLWTMNIHN